MVLPSELDSDENIKLEVGVRISVDDETDGGKAETGVNGGSGE